MNIIVLFLFSIFSFECDNSILGGILGEETAKVETAYVTQLGPFAATLMWTCSADVTGYIISQDMISPSLKKSKTHFFQLTNLESNTNYIVTLTCGNADISGSVTLNFTTWVSSFPQRTRGIWLIGGLDSSLNPIPQIDLFDPVANIWYPTVSTVPTPRVFSTIISHKQKIYIIGGLEKNGGIFSPSTKVEIFNPYSNSWESGNDLPTALHGAISGSIGDSIYIISGATNLDISNNPINNTVLRFYPEIGTSGFWASYTSATTIFPRTDMAGCTIDGTIFYTGGRLDTNGNASIATDAFVPSANTTTSLSEPSLSEAKHGSSGLCIVPKSGDAFPADDVWFSSIGGSTGSGNIFQPITSIAPTNRAEHYQFGSSSFTLGPLLPQTLYSPGTQVSYETRKLFVFGGANILNTPLNTVYSIGSANPTTGSWTTESSIMPRSRFGHKAIRIDR
ncbi:hypothetical protein EHO58_19015 [Leptospira selangorensis]|nr:hypothetical protein EHO58_19015 [Leptospira selangorensis]